MFRITRGHSVQHIHFPLPVIRDLDAGVDDEGKREDGAAPESASPAAHPADADPEGTGE